MCNSLNKIFTPTTSANSIDKKFPGSDDKATNRPSSNTRASLVSSPGDVLFTYSGNHNINP